MPDFVIRVFDPVSGVKQQQISAPDRHAVAALLGVPPQRILSVEEVGGAATPAGSKPWPRAPRGKRFPLQLFSQELAVLLDAGIALLEALSTLREKETRADVHQALDAVIETVREGRSLSVAMQAQPAVFDDLVCAIVAANERTGQLAQALAQHAKYLAWVEALRSRLIAACVYPMLLLVVGGAVIMFLLLFVLPRFAGILDGLGDKLPWASQVLISFGRVAGEHPGMALGFALALVVGVTAVWRHPKTHQALIQWAWRMPVLAPRLRVLALARLYRSLGMLLGAGVPALPALRIVRGVVAAPWRTAVAGAADLVAQGERLSAAFDQQDLATPVARRMLRVGERSGEMAQMLERAAAFHDEEAVRLTELLTRAINPILMLIMGVVIGGIIVLMYLPIFQLVEQVQ